MSLGEIPTRIGLSKVTRHLLGRRHPKVLHSFGIGPPRFVRTTKLRKWKRAPKSNNGFRVLEIPGTREKCWSCTLFPERGCFRQISFSELKPFANARLNVFREIARLFDTLDQLIGDVHDNFILRSGEQH